MHAAVESCEQRRARLRTPGVEAERNRQRRQPQERDAPVRTPHNMDSQLNVAIRDRVTRRLAVQAADGDLPQRRVEFLEGAGDIAHQLDR